MPLDERARVEAVAGERLALILASHRRLVGHDLARDADALWDLPLAVLAHDAAPEPRFFYANRAALGLFRMGAARLLGMPSAHSAEPGHRTERAAMLARLDRDNLLTNYSGIRLAGDGTRWRIRGARLWNLVAASGERLGQAVAISRWEQMGMGEPV